MEKKWKRDSPFHAEVLIRAMFMGCAHAVLQPRGCSTVTWTTPPEGFSGFEIEWSGLQFTSISGHLPESQASSFAHGMAK